MLPLLLRHARKPAPPPSRSPQERFVYGLAQPLLGLKLVLQNRDWLEAAVKPAVLLAGFCALTAALGIGKSHTFFWRFYETFAALAAVPSIVFARHYARLSASVRQRLGFGECSPKREPLHVVVWRAGAQALVVAGGFLPVLALLQLLPGIGKAIAWAGAAAWGLQWVVVDALDDARVMKPGETFRMQEKLAERAPRPWFVRFFYSVADGLPLGGGLVRAFGRLVDNLSKPWREEMALVEANPALAAGFALATAALLATPILNLFFRPIILVGSAHLLGHLEAQEPSAAEPIAAQVQARYFPPVRG